MKTTANFNRQPMHSSQSPTLLITGATGAVGSELTKLLSEQGIPFRALVRTPHEATRLAALPGADIRQGDFNDPLTLANALTGVDRAFLLTNSSEYAQAQQLRFVGEARQAGVSHIVKLSQLAASDQSPVRFLRYHAVVEQAIQQSGMDFTFLRPNLFMQGFLGFRDLIKQGTLFAPIGDAPVSLIDIRDIAAVAVAALTQTGHEGKTYTLTGPQALTHAAIAATFAAVLGRSVTFTDVSPDTMRNAVIQAGFPVWQADGLIEDYAHYSRYEASAVTSVVNDVTAQPPRSFAGFVRAYAPAFT
jgi:uncharacterized protein YbjT (DUF2867 family)